MAFMEANESLAIEITGTGVTDFSVGQDLGEVVEMTTNLRRV